MKQSRIILVCLLVWEHVSSSICATNVKDNIPPGNTNEYRIEQELTEDDDVIIGFQYETLSTGLPKGLSDFTANLDNNTSFVYIAGGCDDPNGNVWNIEYGEFACSNVTNSFYLFDINTNITSSLSNMPHARYRHASVLVNGYVWIHGGRDVMDNLVNEVDVYNIKNESWSTFTDLVSNDTSMLSYQVSDHGGFPHISTNYAYFCGGYVIDYETSNNCFAIDTNASILTIGSTNQTLNYMVRGSMNIGRGDITFTTDDNNQFAMITGGFSGDNGWCTPYGETEIYNFSTNVWTFTSNMNVPRGDNVLVEMNNNIYSIGGERALPNICELQAANNTPGPEQQRLSVDDIEYFNITSGTTTTVSGNWSNLEDLPQYRFRFAAVSYTGTGNGDKVYAFGGQLGYNSTCNCFPITNEITIYTEKFGKATAITDDASPTVSAPSSISAPSPTSMSAPSPASMLVPSASMSAPSTSMSAPVPTTSSGSNKAVDGGVFGIVMVVALLSSLVV